MKRTSLIALLLCLFVQAQVSIAQQVSRKPAPGRVLVRNVGLARISVSKGGLRRTIDLAEDVAGCAYVSGGSKRTFNQQGCAAPAATFKLIDSVTKDLKVYLIVLAEASDNCNVCGQCGASEAYSLIWLELGSDLRLRNRRSVPVEDCRAFISLISPEVTFDETTEEAESPNMAVKGKRLIVEFEKRIFGENSHTESYEFSRLEYSRSEPQNGFAITTELRSKSSQKNP